MFAIMIVVVADVVMRYGLNRPFSWTYDLVGLYFMAGVFFLTLSDAHRAHAHVSVDILLHRFSARARQACEAVAGLASLPVMLAIVWTGASRALDNFVAGDVLAGAIPWPTWVSAALVPVGAGLLSLRLALHLVGHAIGLVVGRELIALTPLSGSEAPEAERFE
jgi:TRAP-type C4-dicarboxylate transport system permease small subunit